MNRAYIIISVPHNVTEQVALALSGQDGVIMVDILEDKPDVIIVVQAKSRQKLAELTNIAMTSVDCYIEDVQLMPACSNLNHEAASIVMRSRRN